VNMGSENIVVEERLLSHSRSGLTATVEWWRTEVMNRAASFERSMQGCLMCQIWRIESSKRQ
jgi:hypothetical protein